MLQGARNIVSGQPNRTVDGLQRTSRELRDILEKLSTGRRVNRASDDASALAVSEGLQSRIRGFKMASRNVNDAMSALNIADSAASSVTSQLQRQRELAVAASSDTLSDQDREALNTEFQAITEEINRTASSANFNRQRVTDGTDLGSGDANIQSGPDAEDGYTLPPIDFATPVQQLDNISLASSADAQEAIEALDSVMEGVSDQTATVGATYNNMLSNLNNLEVAMVNTVAAESIIADQDMAEGITQMVQQTLLNEGATAAFQRFQEINRNQVLGFLQG